MIAHSHPMAAKRVNVAVAMLHAPLLHVPVWNVLIHINLQVAAALRVQKVSEQTTLRICCYNLC